MKEQNLLPKEQNDIEISHASLTTEEFLAKKIESILHELFIYDSKKETEKDELSKIEKLNLSYLLEYSGNDFELLQDAFYQMSPPYLSLYLMKGKVALVKEMIARFDLDFQEDSNSRNALHYACLGVHSNSVEFIINEKKVQNINEQDDFKCSALHYACFQGNYEIAKLLVENGANVNLKDRNKKTPLHYATISRDEKLVELLIENDANCNMQDKEGSTPLHYSAHYNDLHIIKMLINKGKAKTNISNFELINAYGIKGGFSPIDYSKGAVKRYFKKRHCHESSSSVKFLVTLKGIIGGAVIGSLIAIAGLLIIALIGAILSILSIPALIFQSSYSIDSILNSSLLTGVSGAVIGGVSAIGAFLGPVWTNITHFKLSDAQKSVERKGEIFEFDHSRILIDSVRKFNLSKFKLDAESTSLGQTGKNDQDNLNQFIEKEFRSLDD